MNEKHVVLAASARPMRSGARRIRDVDRQDRIEVTIQIKGPPMPAADQMPEKAMTPKEFAAKFGASQADADTVRKVLEGYGLKVEAVSLPACSMRVSGTVAAMEAAFQPNLGIYYHEREGEFRGRTGDLKIPAELDGLITGIFGFDERRVARRKAKRRKPASGSSASQPLSPKQLEQMYNFPAGDAAKQKVAIAEFDGGYFPEDVTAYCRKFGRPVPSIKTVAVGKPVLTLQQILALPSTQRKEELDASVEVMMDVEIVAGLCPKASIAVYFAPFTQKGWVDLINKVIQDRPVTLSISWGWAEDDTEAWSKAALDAINQRLQAAAMLGITVCVASGDDGSGDQLSDGRGHVNFPSSSPYVLSVGGTMIAKSAAGPVEVTWWEAPGYRGGGGGATGGGVSTIFQHPKWQTVSIASINHGAIDGRIMPDIAALAGAPGYFIIVLGRVSGSGGTSASTPLWASLIARINALLPASKKQQFLTPQLYRNGPVGRTLGQLACRDITVGENVSSPYPGVGYHAGPGYDAVTGWGVPDGQALLANM